MLASSCSPLLSYLLWVSLVALLAIHGAGAALVNATIDDHIYSIISYAPSSQWNHQPLQGWEHFFYNGSRSFTYTRGATATFVFTGSAIWAQGPYANDQAQRRIFLDGVDQGVYNTYAPQWAASRPFWGKTGLVPTTHTLVITHDDPDSSKLMVLDAFIVEYDNAEDPFLYTRTTVASNSPVATVTTNSAGQVVSTTIYGGGSDQGGTVAGNPVNDGSTRSHKSNTGVIIGVVVSLVFVSMLCCVAIYLYRKRRARTLGRHRESSGETASHRAGKLPADQHVSSPLLPAGAEANGMQELGGGAVITPMEGQNPSYFHGTDQFNPGIPLNYWPSASATSPADGKHFSHQYQDPQGLAIAERSIGSTSTSPIASGRMEGSAFSSYSQAVPKQVLSTVDSSAKDQIAYNKPGTAEEGEKRNKKEKVVETSDGSTNKGNMGNIGQGKMTDQGASNSTSNGTDPYGNATASRLGRSGSERSRVSRRSIGHEGDDHLAMPPPSYSPY